MLSTVEWLNRHFVLASTHVAVKQSRIQHFWRGHQQTHSKVYLEGRIAIQIKDAKIDIVATESSSQDGHAQPDSLVLLCIWAGGLAKLQSIPPVYGQHLRITLPDAFCQVLDWRMEGQAGCLQLNLALHKGLTLSTWQHLNLACKSEKDWATKALLIIMFRA